MGLPGCGSTALSTLIRSGFQGTAASISLLPGIAAIVHVNGVSSNIYIFLNIRLSRVG